MKTTLHLRLMACLLTLGGALSLRAADLVQDGTIILNPTASGTVSLQWVGRDYTDSNIDAPGLTLSYHDAAMATAVFRLFRASGQYQWQLTTAPNTDRLAMQLGNDHVLTLFDPAATGAAARLVLDPSATDPKITIGGLRVATLPSGVSGFVPVNGAASVSTLSLPATSSGSAGAIYQGGNRLLHTYGNMNFFLGNNAGNMTLNAASAFGNTALGNDALQSLTTGTGNTALGSGSLQYNTSGGGNVAIGDRALNWNSTGGGNLAIGALALPLLTTGGDNLALMAGSQYYNTSGVDNITIGVNTLTANRSGWANVAIGTQGGLRLLGQLLTHPEHGHRRLRAGVGAGDAQHRAGRDGGSQPDHGLE